jgi:RND family efflux transporter MFP subunit
MHLRIFAAALTGAALLLGAGCAKPAPPVARNASVSVSAAPATYSDQARPVRATGLLARVNEAELAFKIGGVVEAVAVRAGDRVKQGEELARLRLDEIDAQVAQAASLVAKAKRDLARVEKLAADRVATEENLQDARTALEVAAAQARIAEFNRRYAVVVAPAAGRILQRLAEPDELVAPGRPVLRFAAEGGGWLVRAGLPEGDVARLRVGDRAEVAAADTPGATVEAEVTQIAEATDPATRTVPVELRLSAAPAGARSGSVAVVSIRPRAVAPRAVVPAAAIVEGDARGASIFVLGEGETKVRRLPVLVEALDGDSVYLRTDLPRNLRVVNRGAEFLRDGLEVNVVPEPAAAASVR